MKKKSTSQSAFFNLRVLIGLFIAVAGVFLALLGAGAFSSATAQPSNQKVNGSQPNIVRMVGPVSHKFDLRSLPYFAPNAEIEEKRLTRYPHEETEALAGSQTAGLPQVQSLIKGALQPAPKMPPPILVFNGMSSAQSGCGCLPPDSNGDVGPNHYVNAVNSSIKIF